MSSPDTAKPNSETFLSSDPISLPVLPLFIIILALHLALLLVTVTDYRVSPDSGYHAAMGRQYGEHGLVPWDYVNYGPTGRPNLQGPFLHMGIGYLGRLLGGEGDDYVLANALLAVLQYAVAMFTVWWISRRFYGATVSLFAFLLVSGGAASAGSFSVGLPSGWNFIFTTWTVYAFCRKRWAAAAVMGALGIYAHIAGFATVPLGLALAALLSRQWRPVLRTGAGVMVLTAPYWIHVWRYFSWYKGEHLHIGLPFDTLIHIAAGAGLIMAVRRWRSHRYVLAMAGALLPWLLEMPDRFLLQCTVVGGILGGISITWVLARLPERARRSVAWAVVVLTVGFPLGVSSLGAEITWAAGNRYPRSIDWDSFRQAASIIRRDGLNNLLVEARAGHYGNAVTVFEPMSIKGGHWIEVRPDYDPGGEVTLDRIVAVFPIPADDPVLKYWEQAGAITVHGSAEGAAGPFTVFTFVSTSNPEDVERQARSNIAREAAWLAKHAMNNEFMLRYSTARKERLAEQRTRVLRMEIELLVWSLSLESINPSYAWSLRNSAYLLGSVSVVLGDASIAGMMSDERHELLRKNLGALSDAAQSGQSLLPVIGGIASDYFWTF